MPIRSLPISALFALSTLAVLSVGCDEGETGVEDSSSEQADDQEQDAYGDESGGEVDDEPELDPLPGDDEAEGEDREDDDELEPNVTGELCVGFDDMVDKAEVANHYEPFVVINTDPGFTMRYQDVTESPIEAVSPPGIIAVQSESDQNTVAADFATIFPIPVSDVSFYVIDAEAQGVFGKITVITLDGEYEVDLVGEGDPDTPLFVDLAGYSHVTEIRIHDIMDSDGVGYDDICLDIALVVTFE